MDEKSDEILNHIESQRDQLGRNLDELESRVKRTTDWRTHYENNPMLILGAALGGGILLGAIVGGTGSKTSASTSAAWSGSSRYSAPPVKSTSSSNFLGGGAATQHARQQASETIDKIKAALIAFGTAKAKEFLSQAVPGLEHHLGDFGFGNQEAEPSSRVSGRTDPAWQTASNQPAGTATPRERMGV